jgi:N-acetylglucosamine-6-phosphate deacetylase
LRADGRVSLPGTPYLAGSSLTLDRAIANTVRFADVSWRDAIGMASEIPAAYMGLPCAGTVTADVNADSGDLTIVGVRD